MPKTIQLNIRKLTLDLQNFRTVEQTEEVQAIRAMVSISRDRFWALTESLLDGYLPTENIIVLRLLGAEEELIVKEGNRRVAALKLIHGLLPQGALNVPTSIAEKIEKISEEWKELNQDVPCAVFDMEEAAKVDHIVALTHGKGEKAGRDNWPAIARARHNRKAKQVSEAGLDLLEKYLTALPNISMEQADNWSGTYRISVLDEAIKKIAPRLGLENAPELAKSYPKVEHLQALDAIIRDIGTEKIGFKTLRGATDFAAAYGIPVSAKGLASEGTPGSSSNTVGTPGPNAEGHSPSSAAEFSGTTSASNGKKKQIAVATNDPKSVMRMLRKFSPLGINREKVVALKKEMLTLSLEKAPMAFCFLLRSAFEISAKAYCEDHKGTGGPSSKDASGNDRKLVEVLRNIVDHLTNNKKDKDKLKLLHGALAELGKPEGMLSVTSMNQLVHNQKFSVLPGDVAVLFANVFPLLETMNS